MSCPPKKFRGEGASEYQRFRALPCGNNSRRIRLLSKNSAEAYSEESFFIFQLDAWHGELNLTESCLIAKLTVNFRILLCRCPSCNRKLSKGDPTSKVIPQLLHTDQAGKSHWHVATETLLTLKRSP